MVKLWDFFMRRKMRLLLLLVTFFMGGCAGYKMFYREAAERNAPEYISIKSWNDDIEIPYTGADNNAAPFFAVMLPDEVITLAEPEPAPELASELVRDGEPESETMSDLEPQLGSDSELEPGLESELELAQEENYDVLDYQDPEANAIEEVAEYDINPEDLDVLEEPTLLESAVMEILPPQVEMNEETLNEAAKSLMQPAQSSITPTAEEALAETRPKADITHDIAILVMTVLVITFSGYLLHQHFWR